MQAIAENTRGLRLIVNLNWDRLLYAGTIVVALLVGTWLGTLAY